MSDNKLTTSAGAASVDNSGKQVVIAPVVYNSVSFAKNNINNNNTANTGSSSNQPLRRLSISDQNFANLVDKNNVYNTNNTIIDSNEEDSHHHQEKTIIIPMRVSPPLLNDDQQYSNGFASNRVAPMPTTQTTGAYTNNSSTGIYDKHVASVQPSAPQPPTVNSIVVASISPDAHHNQSLQAPALPAKQFSIDDNDDGQQKGSVAKRDFEVLWHNLSFTIARRPLFAKKLSRPTILHNLNGYFRSGEVTAIMGPSGAGKSTLLEIISGRRKHGVDGIVQVRGGTDDIKVSFVPQDNYLMELLTVRETFQFASRLINHWQSTDYHRSVADKLMERFGLEKIADTKAKRCSGGQRKRLSIALEVISKPNILILDEPTTGLDSPSSKQVMEIMHELAANRYNPVAIVATIHQPSVALFNKFNRTYILTNNGKCIYQGTPRQLVPTMTRLGIQVDTHTSPSDYIIELAAGDYGPEPALRMVSDAQTKDLDHLVTDSSTHPLWTTMRHYSYPFIKHLAILLERSQLIIYRDPFLTFLRIFMAIFSAIGLSILFGREIGKVSGCAPRPLQLYSIPVHELTKKFEHDLDSLMQNVCLLFLGIMVGFLSGLSPTLLNFPKEMHVFHKEYHNNWYSCITYYTAKMISDLPLQIITPLIYISITYWWSNQPAEINRFIILNTIAILLSLLAQSLGECCSAIYMDNQNAAVFAGGLLPLPMILFGGFLARIDRMPAYMRPASWLSFLRFAFEAMLISTFGLNRCLYDYRQFLDTHNVTTIRKPLWAKAYPIITSYVDQLRGRDTPLFLDEHDEDEYNLQRMYRVFGGSLVKDENGINLDRSLILAFYDLSDNYIYLALGILVFYMVALKVLTYFIVLYKLHVTK
ncbi:ATP-binding cassette sub-family G member 1-like [Oppia nitens]|uniref:ATP-binding cassette sub-family G member 1-like n=1 Tax=Oppia nitens TaxID=1686743 RepID=UPI0023DB7550|nr:ATP-binding cassette sub-family G member 1-like [Oppia nitens]